MKIGEERTCKEMGERKREGGGEQERTRDDRGKEVS